MELHFYYCEICGKVLTVLSDGDAPTYCCGQQMEELELNRKDGAFEKHVPVYSIKGNTIHVNVGSEPHPMTDTHSIYWVGLYTDQGFQFKNLFPGDKPRVCFSIGSDEQVLGVYAYCNLHGLWYSDKEANNE